MPHPVVTIIRPTNNKNALVYIYILFYANFRNLILRNINNPRKVRFPTIESKRWNRHVGIG